MSEVEVSPESMHLCAGKVAESGNAFGRSAETLGDQVADDGLYGADALGSALAAMDAAACPDALDYYRSTGEAVVETSTGIDHMAAEYTRVERDNTAEVDDILDALGTI